MYTFLTVKRNLLNDLFCISSEAKKFLLVAQVMSKILKFEFGRDQIKLNPCVSFRVKDNTITVFADVRKSISNNRLLD